MASGSGTPAPIIDDRMRQNRSTIVYRTTSATTGSFSSAASLNRRPPAERRLRNSARETNPAPATTAHHQSPRNLAVSSTILVGRGSFASNDLKKTSNLGSTKIVR